MISTYSQQRIDNLEAAVDQLLQTAKLMKKEATDLRKSLSPVSERSPRKGNNRTDAKIAASKILSKRRVRAKVKIENP